MPPAANELNTQRIDRMRERLQAALSVSTLEIIDDSARHAGHAGARDGRGHFKLVIAADEFSGLPTLKRHQLIYQILDDMMQTDIHALSIQASDR